MRSLGLLSLGIMALASARADFIVVSLPTAAYTSSTTLVPVPGADGSTVSSLSDINELITLATAGQHKVVPTDWSTWSAPPSSETSTPQVVCFTTACGSSNTTSNTFTLSNATQIFGFEAEPNGIGSSSINANFFNGGTLVGSISQTLSANSGARLFAAQTNTQQFTSVTLSIAAGAGGYAVGQYRYASVATAVPEPSTLALLTLAAAALLLGRGIRKQ